MSKTILCFVLLAFFVGLGGIKTARAQSGSTAGTTKSVAFYVVAHQDDWQLFMGSHAYTDVQRRDKVVFVCLTAGQANAPGDDYWRGREAGCYAAVRAAADANSALAPLAVPEDVSVNHHALQVSRYKNTATYCLRLPDGGLDAKGFARGNFQSLLKFKKGSGPVSSIDGAATYADWADLVKTLRELVQKEAGSDARIIMHYPDMDSKRNGMDHPDHQMAGFLAQAATKDIDCRQLLYLDYITKTKKINLSSQQTANQTLLFKANCQSLVNSGLKSEWEDTHLCWLGRQYFRIRHNAVTPPKGQPLTPVSPLAPSMAVTVPVVPATPLGGTGDVTLTSAIDTTVMMLGGTQAGLRLNPNYPNPFDMSSLLSYQLPKTSFVTMRIFSVEGKLIDTVLEDAKQIPGNYEVWLDVNQFPASGIYICQLQAGREVRTQRLQIIR